MCVFVRVIFSDIYGYIGNKLVIGLPFSVPLPNRGQGQLFLYGAAEVGLLADVAYVSAC